MGEGGGQKGRVEGGEEVEEKEEGEAAWTKEEEAGEGKTEAGIAAVAGKGWGAERGKTEGGGSGGARSGDAEGGSRCWRAGRTGDGETGAEEGTGSRRGECLLDAGRRYVGAGSTVGTGR